MSSPAMYAWRAAVGNWFDLDDDTRKSRSSPRARQGPLERRRRQRDLRPTDPLCVLAATSTISTSSGREDCVARGRAGPARHADLGGVDDPTTISPVPQWQRRTPTTMPQGAGTALSVRVQRVGRLRAELDRDFRVVGRRLEPRRADQAYRLVGNGDDQRRDAPEASSGCARPGPRSGPRSSGGAIEEGQEDAPAWCANPAT